MAVEMPCVWLVYLDCAVAGLAQWLHTPEYLMELTEEVIIQGSLCW